MHDSVTPFRPFSKLSLRKAETPSLGNTINRLKSKNQPRRVIDRNNNKLLLSRCNKQQRFDKLQSRSAHF